MVYTTVANVRLLTNLEIADISDANITSIITQATYHLNADINTRVVREQALQIDNTRKNEINGTNTVYYVRNWRGRYIADMDNDGGIDIGDVIVYLVTSEGTETTATISAVDSDDGKITLSTAPSSGLRVYITYEWAYEDPSTPSKFIELACTLLTAAFCYEKLNRGMSPQQVYGNVRFMRDMRAGNEFFIRYRDMLAKINASMGDFTEAEVF